MFQRFSIACSGDYNCFHWSTFQVELSSRVRFHPRNKANGSILEKPNAIDKLRDGRRVLSSSLIRQVCSSQWNERKNKSTVISIDRRSRPKLRKKSKTNSVLNRASTDCFTSNRHTIDSAWRKTTHLGWDSTKLDDYSEHFFVTSSFSLRSFPLTFK